MDHKRYWSMLFAVISITMVHALEVLDPGDESNYKKKQMQSIRMELDHHRQNFPFATELTKLTLQCLWALAQEIIISVAKEHNRQDLIGDSIEKGFKWVKDKTDEAGKWIDKKIQGLTKVVEEGIDSFNANLNHNVEKMIAIYEKQALPWLKKFWAKAKPVLKKAGLKCWDILKEEAKKYIPLKKRTE